MALAPELKRYAIGQAELENRQMSIWSYDDSLAGSQSLLRLHKNSCPFCDVLLGLVGRKPVSKLHEPANTEEGGHAEVRACELCGWWDLHIDTYETRHAAGLGTFDYTFTRYAHGALRNLDLADISTPLDEVRQYLLVKQEKIGQVAPRLVEELVADIFSNLGYIVELTPQTRDGGIDIFLIYNSKNERIGVEVKRYKKKITVEQIRSFLGALGLSQTSNGIFVGTSGFTSDARRAVEKASEISMAKVELKDATWLMEQLRLTQRSPFQSVDDETAAFQKVIAHYGMLPIVKDTYSETPHSDDIFAMKRW